MKTIKIANDKKRDAQVGYEIKKEKSDISMVLSSGLGHKNVRILKSTIDNEPMDLLREYGSPVEVGQAILDGDPEIDFEKAGMFINGTKKVYIDENDRIAYRINRSELVFNADGSQKEEREYKTTDANINEDGSSVTWSGRLIPKEKAIRMFVFTRSYQVKHVNGLTYDFLYDMAKQLQENNALMLVGSGPKGMGPLVFTDGGTQYRAFMEGRVDEDKYCLILHLSNLELKDIC